MNRISGRHAFTLIELSIAIGILVIMATTAIIVVNPGEYVKQSRDTKRIGDINTLDGSLATSIANSPNIGQGNPQTAYISIPDTATNCPTLTPILPTLPTGWSYYCASVVNYRKTDGTGWMPINFDALPTKSPMPVLPIDPTNDASKGLYYFYSADAGVSAALESIKARNDAGAKDGGLDAYRYEQGKDLYDLPSISLATIPVKSPASVKILIVEYQDCGQALPAQLASLGFTNVTMSTSTATLAAVDAIKPDIVASSNGCWGSSKAALLNQLYDSGYEIYSQGNDNPATLRIAASGVSTSVVSGTITPLAKHAINTGWASTGNSGADGRQGLTANAKAIVLAKDNTLGYDEVIYLEEGGKGKWLDIQPNVRPNDTLLKNGLLYLAR